jgi:hypothetical protein
MLGAKKFFTMGAKYNTITNTKKVPTRPKPAPARDIIASTKSQIILIPYGKTGRPVVGGNLGGSVSIHHPFIHEVPKGQGG